MNEEIETKDKRIVFMRAVYDWASLSKDPRSHIGAVIVKNDIQVSCGYNNFPRGVKDYISRYNDRPTKLLFVEHGERNAIFNAAREGISTLGATIYTQSMPCHECMKAIINSGIIKIVLHKQWEDFNQNNHWTDSCSMANTMREEANIFVEYLDCVLGVNGLWGGKVIYV